MKANQKSRADKAVSAVLGTILMIPIIFMIISAMMVWAQDLIEQMKDFQEEQNAVVNDLEITINAMAEEHFIIWYGTFEGTSLQWDNWKNDAGDPPTTIATTTTEQYFGGTKSCKLEASAADKSSTIGKEFAWIGQDHISIEIYFTVDPEDNGANNYEEFKIFKIYQKLKGSPDEKNNIGEIRIDIDPVYDKHEADVSFYGDVGGSIDYHLIDELKDIPLYASSNCWHHMKLSVNFDKDDGSPKYESFIIDGNEYEFTDQSLDKAASILTYPVEYIKVEYGTHNPNSGSMTSSYVDDFIIRYDPTAE